MPSRSCLHSAFHLRDVITRKQHVLLVSSVWLLANLFSSTLRSVLVTRTFQCNWFSPFSRPLATATGYARSMPGLSCLSFISCGFRVLRRSFAVVMATVCGYLLRVVAFSQQQQLESNHSDAFDPCNSRLTRVPTICFIGS